MAKPKRTFKQRLEELMREQKPPLLDRKGAQPSATELGRFLHVNKQTAENWMKGRIRNLSSDNLFRIANAFGVSARWLWLEEGPRNRRVLLDEDLNRLAEYFNDISSNESRATILDLAQNLHSIDLKLRQKAP